MVVHIAIQLRIEPPQMKGETRWNPEGNHRSVTSQNVGGHSCLREFVTMADDSP